MKKKLIILGVILFIGFEFYAATKITPDLSHVGKAGHKLHEIGGWEIPFHGINTETVKISWIVMGVIILLSFLGCRNLKQVPGRLQSVLELFVSGFDSLCQDTLGAKGRKFVPYVASLFIFICLCNWVSFFPIHGIAEPTKDLNTTLGLGIIAFLVSHIASIRYKGFWKYTCDYFEPMITIGKFKIPNFAFAPLNIIGELGKLISHSFRLYGNILGGAIIIEVVSSLVRFAVLPIFLQFFFVICVGLIQAFVFSVLALAYIAVLVEE